MNQPVRIAPGGIVDVNRYLDICYTATAPMFIRPATLGAYGVQATIAHVSNPCAGCGARKEVFVNGRAMCAYCKGEK